MHELELGDGGIAQSLDLGEPRDRRGDHFRETTFHHCPFLFAGDL
jgi:hypothetical protein